MKEFGKIKERYEFSFDSRKLGLVLLAAFTAAALVFVLGVSVGVQWETKQAEKAEEARAAMPARAPAAPQPETEPVVATPAAPPVEPPAFPVATSAAPAAAKGPGAGQQKQAGAAKPAAAAEELTFPKVLSSNTKKTAPLTPPKKTETARVVYTVQVGAFDDRDSAQSRVDKLRKKEFDARLFVSPDKKDGYPYKVRVGRYSSREEAAATAKKLAAMLQITPYVAAE